MPRSDETEEALIGAVKAGDREAGDRLFALLARPIAAVCRAVCGDPHLAEEASQETFLRLWKARRRIRVGEPIRPLAYEIARNASRDILRRRRRPAASETAPERADPSTPIGRLVEREERETLASLIEGLPRPLREAMVLKHGLLLANDEAAKVLGISREALWTRLSRARQELRRRWYGRV